ncbi:MAG: sugar ABC transporter permease [Acidimicrobiia bacterium]|nr:sugar ABC transporter permease [Acidimicrobiia bacterium]
MGDVISKVVSTLITVVIAVGASAGLWVGANLVFNQVRRDWSRFNAIAYGVIGFVVGAILSGNRLTAGSGKGDGRLEEFASWVWLPLVIGIASAAVGFALSRIEDPTPRLVIGAVGLGSLGLLSGLLLREEYRPDVDIGPLVGWTVAIAAIGGGISYLRKRPPICGVLIGGAIGWILGAFGSPDLGGGSAAWAAVASLVPAAAIGVRVSMTPIPDRERKARIDQSSRAVIFLGPALLFIFATLVVPAIRTMYLSFLDNDAADFVWFDNYVDTFRDPISWDSSDWTNMFTSWPFIIGVVLLVIFVLVGTYTKRTTGKTVELGSASMAPLVIGGLFLAFGVFTALRGTIVNNLWWVVVVTAFSTGLGLAVAVLADNVKFEKVAKSVIFMPMAISLVGAAVIWRFMYVARDSTKTQTGVMNAVWVGLGKLSTGSGIPTIIVGVLVTIVFLALLMAVARALVTQSYARAVVPGVFAILLGWFVIRYWGIFGGGIGGQKINSAGVVVGDPINFVQDPPYNNFWLMVVLIWIQTGFSMVILSAAIKAVPTELIEAARVDGATPSQIFWRVTLPQISTTIGVVVTTLIVLVMKVYDIVKVMTNGNFGTQVLANDMFQQAFQFTNIGRGASLATLLFLLVLPVMIFNIRRMQKEV